jgi:hypothetical protein
VLNTDIGGLGTIAVQSASAVIISGGNLNNVTIGDTSPGPATFTSLSVMGTLSFAALARNVRVVTAAGNVTMLASDFLLVLNKTVGAATNVTLPTAPIIGQNVIIKDGKGDALTNNITVLGAIDGGTSFVLTQAYQAIDLIYTGTVWAITAVLFNY